MTDGRRDPDTGLDPWRRAVMTAGVGGALALGLSSEAVAQRSAGWTGPRFNAQAFGAKGDGRTNDTGALRRAIAAAEQAGGGLVYLPQGVYLTNDLHVGRNGDGRRPSVRNIHIVGEGIGVTTLLHNAGAGEYGAITLIDASQCSVRDLTIDSSRIRGRGTNGGLLMFGCQDCLLENVEVRHSNYRSFSVAGSLFELGRLPARNTVIRRCIARGQRIWDGNAGAQMIASDGATATTFVDCASYAERLAGDLFGADDAPATVFHGCRAYGDNVASGGFWIEHDRGERAAFFSNCYVEDVKNVGIGGTEGAERMQIQNCHINRVANVAIWGAGTGRIFINGCIVEECGKELPRPKGTILLQGGGSISNTRVTNGRRSVPAVSVYNDGHAEPTGLVHVDGCVFDGDLLVLRSAALTVNISATTFLEHADLVVDKATSTTVTATSCLFLAEGIEVSGANSVTVANSVFRGTRRSHGAAITGRTRRKNPVTVTNCSFFDYRKIRTGPLDLHAVGNRFERCGETLADASAGAATSVHRIRLRAGSPRLVPGVGHSGVYLILVAGVSDRGPKAAFVVSAPMSAGASRSLLGEGGAGDRDIRIVSRNGRPALSSKRGVNLRVTVIAAEG